MTEDGHSSEQGYSTEQLADFGDAVQKLRNETAGVQMVLHELAGLLTKARARTFANEGVGRRLPLVARTALNIFKLYPPDTKALLSRQTCDDIGIQLQAFAINVYAIFDNIAWVCMLEAGGTLSPLKVSLFKNDCKPFLPADLQAYLAQESTNKWFNQYGKLYRDSTAHRIAPYLPSRVYTPEQAEKFSDLHSRSHAALIEASTVMPLDSKRGYELLDLHEALDREKETLGSNSLLMALSLTGEDASPLVFLHPQLLCDWGLANELVSTFDRAIRVHYGWPVRAVPSVHVS